jgi:hypothetical protein
MVLDDYESTLKEFLQGGIILIRDGEDPVCGMLCHKMITVEPSKWEYWTPILSLSKGALMSPSGGTCCFGRAIKEQGNLISAVAERIYLMECLFLKAVGDSSEVT